ncbi:hypothetical protein CEP51_002400 [Fusarium floridanum]|uniref:NAD(P)-binding domain-containing protein n=1 Tax=Fusarium floridanum TaxID=1325733 RepID=A0A428SBD9_9HYPO|nr:hypothetical protein CEP51_002400 [Fusarium floridanum]
MAPSIFLTGATGYTGGTVPNTLVTAHPEYDITVLLRKPTKSFLEKYPGVKVLQGDFDSTELLREAASKADIVVHHGNSDHVPAVKALITGVTERAQASEPAFYIHLGGTGIIAESTNVGELHPKVWSDIDEIDAIWSFPIEAIHQDTELLIQDAWTKYGDKLKTAVVCLPNIHGKGTGPGRAESFYVPYFYAESLKLESTFYVGSGSNMYSRVHVEDVAQVFLKLVEAAADGGKGAGWGRESRREDMYRIAEECEICFASPSEEGKENSEEALGSESGDILYESNGVEGIGSLRRGAHVCDDPFRGGC